MGNTFDKFSKNHLKFTIKKRKKKDGSVNRLKSTQTNIYDAVTEEMYAVPNKTRRPQKELHYAEVQVLQLPADFSRGSREKVIAGSGTEYATIDFQHEHADSRRIHKVRPASSVHDSRYSREVRLSSSPKPADILIPSGALHRPIPKPRLRKGSSQKEAKQASQNHNSPNT